MAPLSTGPLQRRQVERATMRNQSEALPEPGRPPRDLRSLRRDDLIALLRSPAGLRYDSYYALCTAAELAGWDRQSRWIALLDARRAGAVRLRPGVAADIEIELLASE